MASLPTKIKLYCEANGKEAKFDPDIGNVHVKDDGQGEYIKSWNVEGLDQPTDEQLNFYEEAGNVEQSNNRVRATRIAAFCDFGDHLDEIYTDIEALKARIKSIKDANPKS